MKIDELRAHMAHLIDTYVGDPSIRVRLLQLVDRDDLPTKGVLAELMPLLPDTITPEDASVIQDITYYFC